MSKSELELRLDQPLRDLLIDMQTRIMSQTSWFGVKALKNPLDFWVYQEIMFEYRPDVVVEIGNHTGGSTLALAHLCNLLGNGEVIGVDINHNLIPDKVKEHPRIKFVTGDACACYSNIVEMIAIGKIY